MPYRVIASFCAEAALPEIGGERCMPQDRKIIHFPTAKGKKSSLNKKIVESIINASPEDWAKAMEEAEAIEAARIAHTQKEFKEYDEKQKGGLPQKPDGSG